jgi:hypothetical protein
VHWQGREDLGLSSDDSVSKRFEDSRGLLCVIREGRDV